MSLLKAISQRATAACRRVLFILPAKKPGASNVLADRSAGPFPAFFKHHGRVLSLFLISSAFAVLLTHTTVLTAAPAAATTAQQRDPVLRASFATASNLNGPAQAHFTLMPGTDTGLVFTNELASVFEATNHNLLNGSGVALGDYNNDGWCDVFLCGLTGPSKLFRNLGNWKFADLTAAAGLPTTALLARGAAFADVDGDSDLDLLVTLSGKGARLWLNQGNGSFKDGTPPDIVAETGSMSIALGDVDGDGDLDLYVANYGENTIRSGMKITTRIVGGREQVVGRHRNRLRIMNGNLVEYGEPDAFYLNDGKGSFKRVSWTGGAFLDESGAPLTEPPWELGFTVMLRDLNQDGHPDLYVCNDFQDPDRIWLGDGKGHFRAAPRDAFRSTPNFSMTVDSADVDNDGHDDLFVTDMLSRSHDLRMRQLKPESPRPQITREKAWDRPQVRKNFLYLNRGDSTYANAANFAGIATSDWTWSAAFIDADLDGWPDVVTGTGHYYDTQDLDAIESTRSLTPAQRNDGRKLLDMFPPLVTPNYAFHNKHNLTFAEVGKAWGLDSTQVTHGIALGDLDNDGDLDIVANCLRAPALVYRNDCAAPRLAVKLRGTPPNTEGIGARVTLLNGIVPRQSFEVTCGSRFLSGDPAMRVFAAKAAQGPMTLEVAWRSGAKSTVTNVLANHLYTVSETQSPDAAAGSHSDAAAQAGPGAQSTSSSRGSKRPSSSATPLFKDVSANLNHAHAESAWDDFARRADLPYRLSAMGPGVSWHDVNDDGREDLLIGSARGGMPSILLNKPEGKWELMQTGGTDAASSSKFPDDATTVLVAAVKEGATSILAGVAHLERTGNSGPDAAVIAISKLGSPDPQVPGIPGVSGGPMCMADVDADGDLDLFIGGRMMSDKYPEPAVSRLLINTNGKFLADGGFMLTNGLATAAVFTDLNGDGFPDLVLAREWDSPQMLRNVKSRFEDWDPPISVRAEVSQADPGLLGVAKLSDLKGWWRSLTAADLDNDGRMDIILGNIGLNSAYHQTAPGPWFLFYGRINDDDAVQTVEAYQDRASNQVLPWRDLAFMEKTFPWIRSQFPTHAAYAKATLAQVLGPRASRAQKLEAKCGSSIVLLNRGGTFELRPLPLEAQLSPLMSVAAADFDGDGNEDIFAAQNDFSMRIEDGRQDAGRGLLLRGDGKGSFTPVSGRESGIIIYGEQRGCAVADFNQDGRPDIAVAQNNGPTVLLQNSAGRPGTRVRLIARGANPEAIGASLRLFNGNQPVSPAKEVRCGGGFWSQDSSVQVIRAPSAKEAASNIPTKPSADAPPQPPNSGERPSASGYELEVRWPGGSVTRTAVAPEAREWTIRQ